MFNLSRFFLRITLATFTLVGLCAQTQAEIANCTNIPSVPFSITASGIYCLNADLVYPNISGAAIAIKANDVTIDLNGFKLRNSHNNLARTAVGIKSTNRKNITLRNGTIRGFLRGVWLKDTSSINDTYGVHLIEDLLLDSNTFLGLNIEGPSNVIRHNRITSTGGSTFAAASYTGGITASGPNQRILDNEIMDSNEKSAFTVDIYSFEASGSHYINNRLSGAVSATGDYGIWVSSGTHVLLQNNSINVTAATGDIGIRAPELSSVCRDNTIINFTNSIRTCTDGGGNVSL